MGTLVETLAFDYKALAGLVAVAALCVGGDPRQDIARLAAPPPVVRPDAGIASPGPRDRVADPANVALRPTVPPERLQRWGNRPGHDVTSREDRGTPNIRGSSADLELTLTTRGTLREGSSVYYEVTFDNHGPDTANNYVIKDLLPADLIYTYHSIDGVSFAEAYDPTTGEWTGTMPSGSHHLLYIAANIEVGQRGKTITNTAEVIAVDEDDPDSTPNNHDPAEDDQASFEFTVLPGLDCNDNGIVDRCEIYWGCYYPGCGKPCGDGMDCNTNGVLDECDLFHHVLVDVSPPQGFTTPVGSVTRIIPSPLLAVSDVTVRVPADNAPPGTVQLAINGTVVGDGAWDGPTCGVQETLIFVPAALFNSLVDGANTELTLQITGALACGPGSSLAVTTVYTGAMSLDCDGNDIPDECDPDCNENGIADLCDIDAGVSVDCNTNGAPDECEGQQDCDDNGIFDPCEIVANPSLDGNGDGIIDDCQGPPPCPMGKLRASDGANLDSFGDAVSIDNGLAVVGAYAVDGPPGSGSSARGSVYAYRWRRTRWVETEFPAPDETCVIAWFGQVVGVSEDVIVVGAPLCSEYPGYRTAYAYRRDGGTWNEYALTPWDVGGGVEGGSFGRSVAISGDVIAVSAHQPCSLDPCEDGGSVYIFEYNPFTDRWEEGSKVTATEAGFDGFGGYQVALSGNRLVTAASRNPFTSEYVRTVFVMERDATDGTWNEIAQFSNDGAWHARGGQFGEAVATDGDVVVVGARYAYGIWTDERTDPGAAYVYHQEGSTWTGQELRPTDPLADEKFGDSVAVDGDVLVVGAPWADNAGVERAGVVYVYRWNGTSWFKEWRLTPPDSATYAYFGSDVSISDGLILVGALFDGSDGYYPGSAYVYALPEYGCSVVVATDSDLDSGETRTLNPGGGSGESTEDALVTVTNISGPDNAMFSVAQISEDLYPDADGFRPLAPTLAIDTTLEDGEFFMTPSVPFSLGDLGGVDWNSVDLVWFDEGSGAWELAAWGNTANSPGHPGPLGDRSVVEGTAIPTLSDDLGDYGVFWNSSALVGFAWANVDHVSEFTGGTPLALGNCDRDNDVDLDDYASARQCLKGPEVSLDPGCECFDFDKDADIDARDIAFFMRNFTGAALAPTDVCIDLTAEVAYVSDPDDVLEGAIYVGQIITGRYIYDSTTVDSSGLATVGYYQHDNPPYGITINAGSLVFRTDPTSVDFLVEIGNDHGTPGLDSYILASSDNSPVSAGVAVDYIFWALDDPTGMTLSSVALPLTPPVLSAWQSVRGMIIWGSPLNGFDEHGSQGEQYYIRADATTASLCPAGARR